MPLSPGDRVAEAVKEAINAEDFGVAFTASRTDADLDTLLEETSDSAVRVDVMAWECPYDRVDSSAMSYYPTTRVIVRKRMATTDRDGTTGEILNASRDALNLLLQKILEHFAPSQEHSQTGHALSGYPQAAWHDMDAKQKTNHLRPVMRTAGLYVGWVDITHAVTITIGAVNA